MTAPEDLTMLTVEGEETTVIWETSHPLSFGGGGGDGSGAGDSGGGGGSGDGGGGGGSEVGATTITQPDPAADVAEHEEADEYDPNGNLVSHYVLDRTTHPDGSTEWRRSDVFTNGATSESAGGTDVAGNGSYTESITYADGSGLLITRTTDPAGHGTEHRTELDPAGNATSDTTTDF